MTPSLAQAQIPPSATQPAATSQDASPPDAASDATVGEIVVTAQKRTETLQRTAAAVQVVDSQQLTNRGVTNLVGLSNLTAGVVIVPNRQIVQIVSRGLGQTDAQQQTTPAVEVSLDGAGLPKTAQQFAFFDVANIQVLKGPQGILYGRNAIGGAIVISAKRPSLTAIAGEGSFEYGNYDLYHGFAALNLPVTSGIAVRGAFDFQKHAGYLTNGGNSQNQKSGRLSVLAEPTDRLSIYLAATYSDRRNRGFPNTVLPLPTVADGNFFFVAPSPTSGIVGPIDFSNARNSRGYGHFRSLLLNGELSYELADHLTLLWSPSYFDYKSEQVNSLRILPFSAPLNRDVDAGYTANYFNEGSHDVTNEVRLSYDRTGVTAVAGLLVHSFDAPSTFLRVGYPSGPLVNGPLHALERNLGGFADVRVAVAPSVRLEGGIRYSRDRKGVSGLLTGQPVSLNGDNFAPFKATTWKVGAEVDVAPAVMAYANVQTGYLPGAYQTATQATLNSLGLTRRYDSQKLTAYTAGVKSRLLDNRLQINAEGFYYDYSNYQVNQRAELIVGGVQSFQNIFANVAKSRIYGADVDLIARPIRNGELNIGLSLLDAKIVRTGFGSLGVFQRTGLYAAAADPSLHGYQLPNAPTLTLNLGYEQRFPLANDATIVASANTHHESSRWLDYTHPDIAGAHGSAFWKTDLSLRFDAPGQRWSLGVWARNLENTATYSTLTPQPLRQGGLAANPVIGYYSTVQLDIPRTYGVRAGVRF